MLAAPASTDTLIPRRDLAFLLYEWLGLEELLTRPRYAEHSREVVDDILELAERIARERFAPHNRIADEHEPQIGEDGRVVLVDQVKPALEAFFASGLAGASMPAEVGGLELPHIVGAAAFAQFQAANAGSAAYAMLTTAAANLLIANADPEQVERFVPPMLEGRFFGTMCLSETQAGSSLSDITTRAEPQDDGSYRLFGSKMWISGGDHELAGNIIHLVLAKLPGSPAGVKGISLFIVPRLLMNPDGSLGERNDIALAGLNHKMGFRGTVNTVLAFGDGEHRPGGQAGAVGYLIGEPHRGLAYMFHMMNEARVGVGLGATALGYTGYRKALRYARERPQGRPPLGKDPAAPQIPIVEHADVKRMLLAQKSYVEGALGLLLLCSRLLDDEATLEDPEARADAHRLLELLTPIAKSWPSQWCLEANSLAIQVHGGYGYARDYEVEQHYRDNRLNPIHEGTHGIQALDLLGRKVTQENGRALALLSNRMQTTITRAREAGGEAATLAQGLDDARTRLLKTTATLWSHGPEVALALATPYMEAAGHIVIAWVWLEQYLAAGNRDEPFYEGKRAAARYFHRLELPQAVACLDVLSTGDRTFLDADQSSF